jgi:uncharacterized protein YndB with AHSA1/START domain
LTVLADTVLVVTGTVTFFHQFNSMLLSQITPIIRKEVILMADVVVRGEIDNRNDAEFRAVVSCPGPSGSIRGEIDAVINGRRIEYSFRSTRPSRLVASRSGNTRSVNATFRNARVTNRTSGGTTTGATITLSARRRSTGRRTATLTIRRPGRATLRASGVLDDSVITVNRRVSCRR